MLTRLLVFLCSASPFLRRALWRWWYSKLARQIETGEWTFMNYGFAPSPNEVSAPLKLPSADEPDRFCIQLYERVISPVSLQGIDVLEVGSGRGGGASYLARQHQPKQLTGIDYSPQAVAFCRRRHDKVNNLCFVPGDAENLPFPDASFDAVINVESSHCYGDVKQFFSEAARVLRPGGHFLFADLREAAEMEELKSQLNAQTEWNQIQAEDITANVASALAADDDRKRKMIAELVPDGLRPLFEEFAGLSGGKVSQGLQTRKLLYWRFAFQRRAQK